MLHSEPSDRAVVGPRTRGRGALWPWRPSCCQTSSCAVCEFEALSARSLWVHSSCNSRPAVPRSWRQEPGLLMPILAPAEPGVQLRLGCRIPSSPSLLSLLRPPPQGGAVKSLRAHSDLRCFLPSRGPPCAHTSPPPSHAHRTGPAGATQACLCPGLLCAGRTGRCLPAEPVPQSMLGLAMVWGGGAGCWPQRHRCRLSCQSVMPFWPHRGILFRDRLEAQSLCLPQLPILSAGVRKAASSALVSLLFQGPASHFRQRLTGTDPSVQGEIRGFCPRKLTEAKLLCLR